MSRSKQEGSLDYGKSFIQKAVNYLTKDIFRWSTLSDDPLTTYMVKSLLRTDDKELFLELMKIFKKDGKEELRKHLQQLVSQLEEA